MEALAVSTPAFGAGGTIPGKFTCDGENISPAIDWEHAPAGTRSIALIVEDPDAPGGIFTHWIICNIPGSRTGIPAGVPQKPVLPDGSIQGLNNFGRPGYSGPCPPRGPPHRYIFRLFCLDIELAVRPPARKDQILAAMSGHVLGSGEVVGRYSRR